jgi:phosphoribosylaminoimidazole-succinocarboxamide synthase
MDDSRPPFPLPETPLLKVEGVDFPRVASGKVREVFDMGGAYLMVATDRISAFDVIMNEGVPGKGIILTQMSLYWFGRAAGLTRHHLMPDHEARLEALGRDHPELRYRSMIVRKLEPLPIEAVVRGYLSGSGWKAYAETGRLFEYALPAGLEESAGLPEPLFTPSTKAQDGHDLPIDCADAARLVGVDVFRQVRELSIELYRMGAERATAAGLILADTKFEFGLDGEGRLFLIDEILTPDSSRFWPRDRYVPGRAQPSFDKQFVRDYLETLDWDKAPPPPPLPPAVIEGTLQRYLDAYRLVAGGG